MIMKPKTKAFHPSQQKKRPGYDESLFYREIGILSGRNHNLQKSIRAGLSVDVLDILNEKLDISQGKFLEIINLATPTLARRRKTKQLNALESDRLFRVATIYRATLELFEDDRDAAKDWLKQPAKALGGKSPFSQLDTQAGTDNVRDLIGRLEHGVFT